MDFNDILYLLVLISSICFGNYVTGITDVDKRQRICTLAGFAIVFLTARTECVYPLGLVLVNSLIILKLRRFSHLLTFTFSLAYLSITRYYQCLSGHTNLIQMMLTLKLIGLSFELKDNAKLLAKINSSNGDWDRAENLKYLLLPQSELGLVNIVHYCFCYVGVLTGPYYKYQTYLDMFNPRINKSSNPNRWAVLKRLIFLPFYIAVFLLISHFYSIDYVRDASFYSFHPPLYRWAFSLPVFFTFKMRLYIGLLLSEAVAIMAGLGAYPAFTEPKPGHGPTTNVIAFRKIAVGETELEPLSGSEVNFNTVYSVGVRAVETEPCLRHTIKLWNTTVQYWIYECVYKRVNRQKLRIPLVFFVSALWHGLHSGYYLSLCYMPVYLYIEDLYVNKMTSSSTNGMWSFLLLVGKTLTLSSLCMCFVLLQFSAVVHYFSSIYFAPFVVHLFMWAGITYGATLTAPLVRFGNRYSVLHLMNAKLGNVVDFIFAGIGWTKSGVEPNRLDNGSRGLIAKDFASSSHLGSRGLTLTDRSTLQSGALSYQTKFTLLNRYERIPEETGGYEHNKIDCLGPAFPRNNNIDCLGTSFPRNNIQGVYYDFKKRS
uniref:Lysophospholipid acyltransferase 7 n=1 Tax=Cacopsylla melanoneura TaxID=428564 RepID=A0A8D8SLD6_9HEMI